MYPTLVIDILAMLVHTFVHVCNCMAVRKGTSVSYVASPICD